MYTLCPFLSEQIKKNEIYHTVTLQKKKKSKRIVTIPKSLLLKEKHEIRNKQKTVSLRSKK